MMGAQLRPLSPATDSATDSVTDSAGGLSEAETTRRLAADGRNELKVRPRDRCGPTRCARDEGSRGRLGARAR